MTSIRRKLKQSIQRKGQQALTLAKSAGQSLSEGLDRLSDRRVCLGITGLSGSGKTTLITSLIHQLRHYPEAALAAFPPALQNRLLGVNVYPLPGLPVFPYLKGNQALSSGHWPEATRDESGCLLEIKFRARPGLLRKHRKSTERLFLEIRDYPGEWLLDLPLMEMSYLQWCRQYQRVFENQSPLAKNLPFIQNIAQLDPLSPISPDALSRLWQQQQEFLRHCQHQGLSLIQPGRLLHASKEGAESQFPFIPLPHLDTLTENQIHRAADHSALHICQKHFHHYLNQWVKPFYRNTFQKVDRQLVLIDVLQGLSRGQEAMDNLHQSLTQILQSFEYGRNSLIRKLIQPRIDRVTFAASKIDQVLPDQHENVRYLTAELVREAQRRATFNDIDVRCEATAAVRSTSYIEHQGNTVLQGVTDDGPGLLSHPPIPEQIPTKEEWDRLDRWQLRRIMPPSGLQLDYGRRLPHIRIDSILNDLLGDKFL